MEYTNPMLYSTVPYNIVVNEISKDSLQIFVAGLHYVDMIQYQRDYFGLKAF